MDFEIVMSTGIVYLETHLQGFSLASVQVIGISGITHLKGKDTQDKFDGFVTYCKITGYVVFLKITCSWCK